VVLDVKALTWAAKNEIDTPKLKRAKVPIYGKWYFPEIPPNVPLVNLETGEQQIFPVRMIAGEVVFVPSADLIGAGLAPADFTIMQPTPAEGALEPTVTALAAVPPEPLVAMARPPGVPLETEIVPVDGGQAVATPTPPLPAGIHMPSASIAPFILAIGFCLVFLGLISSVIIVIVGLLWMLAGAIVWIRIGVLEERAAHGHVEAEPVP
jgi:hypothetical protein